MQIPLRNFRSNGFDQGNDLRKLKLGFIVMHADFRALAIPPNMRVCDACVRFHQLFQLLKSPDVIGFAGKHRIQIKLASAADIFSGFYTDVSQALLSLFFFVMMIVVVMLVITARPVLVMFFGMFVIVMIVGTTRPVFVMLSRMFVIVMIVGTPWPMLVMFFRMFVIVVIMAAAWPVFVMGFVSACVAVLVLTRMFVMIVFATRMMNVFGSFLRWGVAGHFSVLQN